MQSGLIRQATSFVLDLLLSYQNTGNKEKSLSSVLYKVALSISGFSAGLAYASAMKNDENAKAKNECKKIDEDVSSLSDSDLNSELFDGVPKT